MSIKVCMLDMCLFDEKFSCCVCCYIYGMERTALPVPPKVMVAPPYIFDLYNLKPGGLGWF